MSPPSPDSPSRRDFLKATVTGATVLLVAAAARKTGILPIQPKNPPSPDSPPSPTTPPTKKATKAPTRPKLASIPDKAKNPTTIPTPENTTIYQVPNSNVVITLTQDGIPINYQTADGSIHQISQLRMKALQAIAVTRQEPAVGYIVDIPPATQSHDQEKHPISKELPSDILSPEELKEVGITIVQANSSQLYLRKSILSEGSPLEPIITQPEQKLDIVLFDEHFLDSQSMQDSRYQNYRTLLKLPHPIDTQDFRDRQILKCKKDIKKLNTRLKQSLESPTPGITALPKNLREQLFQLRANQAVLERANQERLNLLIQSYQGESQGLSKKKSDNHFVIFISVAQNIPDQLAIGFDSEGKLKTRIVPSWPGPDTISPRHMQSHPSPEDLQVTLQPKSYQINQHSPGTIGRHEIGHVGRNLTGQRKKWASTNERETDLQVIVEIQQAWQKWQQTGDNTGYYLVFSLPDNSGYILTKRPSTPQHT